MWLLVLVVCTSLNNCGDAIVAAPFITYETCQSYKEIEKTDIELSVVPPYQVEVKAFCVPLDVEDLFYARAPS